MMATLRRRSYMIGGRDFPKMSEVVQSFRTGREVRFIFRAINLLLKQLADLKRAITSNKNPLRA